VPEPLYPPTGDELKLLRFLDAMDSEGESIKREVARSWDENIRQVRGDQWRLRRPPYFLANVIKNQMKRKIASLTEVKPRFRIGSKEPGRELAANELYQACKAILDQSHVQDSWYRMAQFGFTTGSAFIQTTYDPVIDDIVLSYIDPRRVYIDPGLMAASELGTAAQYIRIDTIMALADIRRRFPGRGSLVKPDERYSSYAEGYPKGRTSLMSSVLSMMPRPFKWGQPVKVGPIPRTEVR